MSELLDKVRARADSWVNTLTGLGDALRDKQTYTRFTASVKLSDQELENLFHDNDLAGTICDALPEAALRKGYYLSAEEDHELAEKMAEYSRGLKFTQNLLETAVWSRVFGGAVLYLGIEDGQEEDQPVNMEAIKTIRFALPIEKPYLVPYSVYSDKSDPKYNNPETYMVGGVPTAAGGSVGLIQAGAVIHETRLLRLDGVLTSKSRQARNAGWSESVLQKAEEALRGFGSSWQGVTHLMQDAAQGIFMIKGLIDMIASGDKEILNSRMEAVEMGRSVARAIVVDAEHEDFKRAAYNFAGIPEVLRMLVLRLAAAARMPVTVLMGQSPSGLNATGDSDIRLWYDRVEAYQSQELEPVIRSFFELVFAAQDFEGALPKNWVIKFSPLWQLTALEQADLEKKTAEKDKTNVDAGVILPEEVTLNRFKARGFSQETQVDLGAREEMLNAELKLAQEKAGEDPLEDPLEVNAPPEPAPKKTP